MAPGGLVAPLGPGGPRTDGSQQLKERAKMDIFQLFTLILFLYPGLLYFAPKGVIPTAKSKCANSIIELFNLHHHEGLVRASASKIDLS